MKNSLKYIAIALMALAASIGMAPKEALAAQMSGQGAGGIQNTVQEASGHGYVWERFEEAGEIPKVGEKPKLKQLQELPSSYDARDFGYVTPVKSQGKRNTCWAFSVISCAESSMLSKGYADVGQMDLSERHLAYFCYHPQADPLGNTLGDGFEMDDSLSYLDLGGNALSAAFTLANWMGPANESVAPYGIDGIAQKGLGPDQAYQDVAHLANAYWISAAEPQQVKSMVMEHGAACLSIGDINSDNGAYYNRYTYAYCSRQEETSHVVTVIGWDDAYPATNFNTICRPSSDGAWLAKNSWSKNWGDKGYFWISYEDAAINQDSSAFYFFDMEPAGNYGHNYQYDGSTGTAGFSEKRDFSVAAIYKTGTGATGVEALGAVGIAVYGTNIGYNIQVYKDVSDMQDPQSGHPVFETPQTGTFTYSGFYTIPLAHAVPMASGCTFSVVLTLEQEGDAPMGCFVDRSYDSYKKTRFVTSQSEGQTLFKYVGSGSWADTALGMQPYTLRLKAFTSDIQPAGIETCSLTLSENTFAYDGTAKEPEVTVRDGSLLLKKGTDYTARYSDNTNAGTAAVTVTGMGSYTGELTGHFIIQKADSQIGARDYEKTASKKAQSFDLEVTYNGDGTLTYSSDHSSVAVDAHGRVTIAKNFVGKAKITITADSKNYNAAKKTVKVTVDPAGTEISSVQNLAGRSVMVTWASDTSVTGYEVECSVDKKFTGPTAITKRIKKASATSQVILGMEMGRTYYVRLRTYKTVAGKKFYSGWSAKKAVKIKK